MKERLILGLVGTLGAGKSTVVDYLTSKGFDYIKLSNIIRENSKKKRLDRGDLQNEGDRLRKEFGGDFLAKKAWGKISKDKSKNFLVDGLRNTAEVEFLRTKKGFYLVSIDKHPRSRFKRLKIRGSERDPKTWEEFRAMEQRDLDEHKEFGQQTRAVMKMADFSIQNDSPIEFFLAIEDMVKKLTS
ncbi:MAG: AAA family ATPase [Candidatus Woykebacteria bacterium]